MAKRKVVWTRTADLQYTGVLKYWVNKNKSNVYSKKLVKLVSEITEKIAGQPNIYRVTEFENTRTASLGNYNIFYKVSEKEIIITSFWDNRQDPKKLLKALTDNK